jgi:hypothetical protein
MSNLYPNTNTAATTDNPSDIQTQHDAVIELLGRLLDFLSNQEDIEYGEYPVAVDILACLMTVANIVANVECAETRQCLRDHCLKDFPLILDDVMKLAARIHGH